MRNVLVFLFFIALSFQGFSQEYRSHKVEDGDTVYSLAEKYNTTEEAIYALNPSAKTSIQIGQVLVIPPKKITNGKGKKPLRFEEYIVSPKETVFGISQQYGIDMANLKEYNPHLYQEELGIGDTLQIPVYTKGDPRPINYNESILNSTFGTLKHVVLPKETKYGIARKYGIELERLKALNPNMNVIKPGQVLLVRKRKTKGPAPIPDPSLYTYYEVEPYDQNSPETIYSLTRKFNISRDSLFALNPSLKKDGLEAGMRLVVPKMAESYSLFSEKIVDLEKRIKDRGAKNIVLLLPFNLDNFEKDSLLHLKSQLKRDRVARISLDFYSGVLIALKKAKKMGISVNLKVFDTEQNKNTIRQLIRSNDFSETHAVIGPLLGEMVEVTARELRRREIPVFSPLTKMDMSASKNLVQTRPTDAQMQAVMIHYLKKRHKGENIVIITNEAGKQPVNNLQIVFPGASVLSFTQTEENTYLEKSQVAKQLEKGKPNWVLLQTDKTGLIGMALSHLNLLRDEFEIRLFTTNRNSAFEDGEVSNTYLKNLGFTFPTFTKEFDKKNAEEFILKYKTEHGIKPSKFAVRGFDLTYDVLLRLASSRNLYDSLSSDWTTEYVENKFHYKEKQMGGYLNNAVYILKYGEGMKVEPVEP